jgi:hypothetical protein
MAKSTFPRSGTNGYFVVFGDEHWIAMEAVYGNQLPKKIRDLISLATLFLTLTWPEERTAPSLSGDTTKRFNQLIELADQLRSELFSAHMWLPNYQPDDLRRTVLDNLKLRLDEVRPGDDFDLLRVCLSAVIEIGDAITRKMSDVTFGHQSGRAWSVWVVLMTLIMDSHGLPSGTRGRSSPFLSLIKYLQNHALQGNRRIHSEGALSKAIQRARESIDVPFEVNPKEIEGFIYRLLGIADDRSNPPSHPTDMEIIVSWVLGGRAAGIYPVVPEPLFYNDDFPEPISGGQQATPEPKRRGPERG